MPSSDHQCKWHKVEDFEIMIQTNSDYTVIIFTTPGSFGKDYSAVYLSPQQLDHLIHRALEAKKDWIAKGTNGVWQVGD